MHAALLAAALLLLLVVIKAKPENREGNFAGNFASYNVIRTEATILRQEDSIVSRIHQLLNIG